MASWPSGRQEAAGGVGLQAVDELAAPLGRPGLGEARSRGVGVEGPAGLAGSRRRSSHHKEPGDQGERHDEGQRSAVRASTIEWLVGGHERSFRVGERSVPPAAASAARAGAFGVPKVTGFRRVVDGRGHSDDGDRSGPAGPGVDRLGYGPFNGPEGRLPGHTGGQRASVEGGSMSDRVTIAIDGRRGRRPPQPARQAERGRRRHVQRRSSRRARASRPTRRCGPSCCRARAGRSAPASTSAAFQAMRRTASGAGDGGRAAGCRSAARDGRAASPTSASRPPTSWTEMPVPGDRRDARRARSAAASRSRSGADIRIVAPDAKLSVLEIRWGLIPDMTGTPDAARAGRASTWPRSSPSPAGWCRAPRRSSSAWPPASPTTRAPTRWRWRTRSPARTRDAIRGREALLEHGRPRSAREAFLAEERTMGSLIGSPQQRSRPSPPTSRSATSLTDVD